MASFGTAVVTVCCRNRKAAAKIGSSSRIGPSTRRAAGAKSSSPSAFLDWTCIQAAAAHDPIGVQDPPIALGGGKVRVRGWALDPDNRSAGLAVHVYADGRMLAAIRTGVARPDVARARQAGPRQGYSADLAVARGRHSLCTYAINLFTGTGNPALGCRTVTVT